MKVTLYIHNYAGVFNCETKIGDHLIITQGRIPSTAESAAMRIIKKEHGHPTEIIYRYDLYTYLIRHDEVSLKAIAKESGINESLMRQYACGDKIPSEKRTKQIQNAIRSIGRRFIKTTLIT